MVGKTQIKCEKCGKSLNKKDIGLTKKMISKKTLEFYCIDCLAEYLGTTKDILEEKIMQFIEEGCELFI